MSYQRGTRQVRSDGPLSFTQFPLNLKGKRSLCKKKRKTERLRIKGATLRLAFRAMQGRGSRPDRRNTQSFWYSSQMRKNRGHTATSNLLVMPWKVFLEDKLPAPPQFFLEIFLSIAGILKLYEQKLKAMNPNVRSITYDVKDLNIYIDSVVDMSCLV